MKSVNEIRDMIQLSSDYSPRTADIFEIVEALLEHISTLHADVLDCAKRIDQSEKSDAAVPVHSWEGNKETARQRQIAGLLEGLAITCNSSPGDARVEILCGDDLQRAQAIYSYLVHVKDARTGNDD